MNIAWQVAVAVVKLVARVLKLRAWYQMEVTVCAEMIIVTIPRLKNIIATRTQNSNARFDLRIHVLMLTELFQMITTADVEQQELQIVHLRRVDIVWISVETLGKGHCKDA